jgi:large subunit ribosomal protein L3
MTRVVKDNGTYVPVTIIQCSPNTIHQIKTAEKDGYNAVVLGFDPKKKPTKTKKFYFLREFKVDSTNDLEKGKNVDLSSFAEGDQVSLTGVTKGKGMQGVMKRWNFHGGPGSHGSHFKREPGSVGARAKPGKIHIGHKMAGHMGNVQMTVRQTSVEYVDLENNLIGIKGPVPGSINSYVTIKKLA